MKNLSILLIFVLKLCLIELSLTFEYSPIVQTEKGPVIGRVFTTIRASKKYHSYRGIPYAKPPLGYLKFAAPKKPNAWKEVFNATKESNICPQIMNNRFIGNEDCLQLNVYTPQLPENGKKPKAVLCWIYGGSFIHGQNSKKYWSPDYFIEEDVIVVTINYRLGALGFLSLKHENASGNAGLKDQNLAMKWIRDNIQNFGGDPKKVTLGGQSAGSVSVGYHILSERSKGLFRNTISMSGVPLCFWGFDTPVIAADKSRNIANNLGYKGSTTKELLQFYYNVDVKRLTEVVDSYSLINVPLQPVLEDSHYIKDAFLSTCSLKKYKSGDYNHGPILLGYTKNETMAYFGSSEESQQTVQSALAYAQDIQSTQSFEQLSESSALSEDESLGDIINEALIKSTTEIGFIAPIDYTQQLLSKQNDSIYYYRYDFDYENSLHKIDYGIELNGSAHGDDLVMIFYSDTFQINPKLNNSVTLLQKRMTRMWANMIKYGNPTPNGTNDNLLNIIWPDSRNSGKMLWLDNNLEINDRYSDIGIISLQLGIKLFGGPRNGCDLNYSNKK